MPALEDFFDELRAAGVRITGEDQFMHLVNLAPTEWLPKVADLFRTGRKTGITFKRANKNKPSDEVLRSIVSGYPFSEQEQLSIVSNVLSN